MFVACFVRTEQNPHLQICPCAEGYECKGQGVFVLPQGWESGKFITYYK